MKRGSGSVVVACRYEYHYQARWLTTNYVGSNHHVCNLSRYYWILAICPPSAHVTKSTWLLILSFQLLGSALYFKVSIPFQVY